MTKISCIIISYTKENRDTYYLADRLIYDRNHNFKDSFHNWIEEEIQIKLHNDSSLKDEGIKISVIGQKKKYK